MADVPVRFSTPGGVITTQIQYRSEVDTEWIDSADEIDADGNGWSQWVPLDEADIHYFTEDWGYQFRVVWVHKPLKKEEN